MPTGYGTRAQPQRMRVQIDAIAPQMIIGASCESVCASASLGACAYQVGVRSPICWSAAGFLGELDLLGYGVWGSAPPPREGAFSPLRSPDQGVALDPLFYRERFPNPGEVGRGISIPFPKERNDVPWTLRFTVSG